MYGCEGWTVKKAEYQRIDAYELWCWWRLLRVLWISRSNQSILKEIKPENSLERLMMKLQYLATWCEELTHWKRLWCWERLKVGEEGDDRGWDSWMASLTRWTWVWTSSGAAEGQGSLACCSVGGLPSSGIELLTPALAGGFSTTEPLGKPHVQCYCLSPPYVCTHTHTLVHAHTLRT